MRCAYSILKSKYSSVKSETKQYLVTGTCYDKLLSCPKGGERVFAKEPCDGGTHFYRLPRSKSRLYRGPASSLLVVVPMNSQSIEKNRKE